MKKWVKFTGVISGLASAILWIRLNFYNPYSPNTLGSETTLISFLMLLLPACLAVISSATNKQWLMFIAFVWSFPLSVYLAFTPGVFALFGVTCLGYLMSFLLMRFTKASKAA